MDIVKVSLDSFPGIRIGQTENKAGGTGITVLLCEDPEGMRAGLHIGGGGPAARETGILNPVATAQRIHAAVLGGGSAFGLDAAGGVMRYLEKKVICRWVTRASARTRRWVTPPARWQRPEREETFAAETMAQGAEPLLVNMQAEIMP